MSLPASMKGWALLGVLLSACVTLDLFRLEDLSSVIVCTERFVDACKRLGLDGVVFHPLPARA
ncbi:double-CXXCG motif protein [Archangium gephyra]|uniref:double-CXXCG motif protein n=1 Tax=Archangium gephyra TaxID=48 RepID=UPI003B783E89